MLNIFRLAQQRGEAAVSNSMPAMANLAAIRFVKDEHSGVTAPGGDLTSGRKS